MNPAQWLGVRKLIYTMGVSLDGFTAGPGGEIDWGAPDEELHRFHNEQTGELDAHLCGRRLYEEMLFWERFDESRPAVADYQVEFARVWKRLPKIVFSTTLARVEGNARLADGTVAEEVARLKAQPGRDLAVGGPGLAGACIRLGLIDEFHLLISPIVLGGGTPYFPTLDARVPLELVESRTFGSRVVYARYRRGGGGSPSQ